MGRSVRTRWLWCGLAAAVAIILAALAWVGVRALMAKEELEAVTSQLDGLRAALADNDLSRLQRTAEEIGPRVGAAAALTGDPIWRATEIVPILGPNLAAARVASTQLDTMVNALALPLLKDIPRLAAPSGGIDTEELERAARTLTRADAELQRGQRDVDGLRLDDVIPAVANGVHQLRTVSDELTPIVHAAAPLMHIAPGLLGADGPRHVLLIVQNNAELRTGGGISGSFIDLVADKGKLMLGGIASDAAFPISEHPVAEVPKSTVTLYGDAVGTHVQNTTMPADFAVTAGLASAWWRTQGGEAPDAVASIDPVVLAALLKATGPTKVGGVTLSADNVVRALLVDSYLTLPEDQQDPFFEAAAAAVFSQLTQGRADALALTQALGQPLTQGRIALWSSRPDEQRVLGGSAVGGPAERQRASGEDAYAVYLNDATGSKMDSFLQTSITSGSAQCRSDGRRDVVVRVTLRSTAPKDAAISLPGTVTGWGLNGTPAGDISTIVSVAAPAGTFFGGAPTGGDPASSADAVDAGFPTRAITVLLEPGQEKTLEFRFIAARTGHVEPVILHTPMMNDPAIESASVACR